MHRRGDLQTPHVRPEGLLGLPWQQLPTDLASRKRVHEGRELRWACVLAQKLDEVPKLLV